MLTRKTYEAFADMAMNARQNAHLGSELDVMLHYMANYFEDDNPRFDRKKFMARAGVTENDS